MQHFTLNDLARIVNEYVEMFDGETPVVQTAEDFQDEGDFIALDQIMSYATPEGVNSMASQGMIDHLVQRAAEVLEIMNKQLPAETDSCRYEPNTGSWHAYLVGSMSVLLESMSNILVNDLRDD